MYNRAQRCTIVRMDALPSAKFRKKYASLTKEVLVTVNGHVIGKWVPIFNTGDELTYDPDGATRIVRDWDRYNTRPFQPVPKHK